MAGAKPFFVRPSHPCGAWGGFSHDGRVLVYAGRFAGQSQINGIGVALEKIEAISFGTILLSIIAAGFIAYGLYLIFVAKYLRLISSW